MSLLDFFKKGKKEEEKKETEKKEIKKEKKSEKRSEKRKEGEEKKDVQAESLRIKKKIPEDAYKILISPHITEKTGFLANDNKYTFKVRKEANKTAIKRIIKNMYGVDVLNVKIINIPAKKKYFRGRIGWQKGFKKAIVTIKEGQKIDILPR